MKQSIYLKKKNNKNPSVMVMISSSIQRCWNIPSPASLASGAPDVAMMKVRPQSREAAAATTTTTATEESETKG